MGRKKKVWAERIINEKEADLKTGKEIEGVSRNSLQRTFQISEEDNEDFCE